MQNTDSNNGGDGIERLYGEDAGRYYVFAQGGSAPAVLHDSRYKAAKEARRLARKHPGTRFHMVKLKESVIFRQDVKLDTNIKITRRDHAQFGKAGLVLSIDPNGAYGIKLTDSTLITAHRDDFEIVIPAVGDRVWYHNSDGKAVLATIDSVNASTQTYVSRMDEHPSGPLVTSPFDHYRPVSVAAFTVGQRVRVRATHFLYALQTGYIVDISGDSMHVRLDNHEELTHFQPRSLMAAPGSNVFAPGKHIRVKSNTIHPASGKVGIVVALDGGFVRARFDGNGREVSVPVTHVRPASMADYVNQRTAINYLDVPQLIFWLGAEQPAQAA